MSLLIIAIFVICTTFNSEGLSKNYHFRDDNIILKIINATMDDLVKIATKLQSYKIETSKIKFVSVSSGKLYVVDQKNIDTSKTTKIFIPGWRTEANDTRITDLAKAYADRNVNNFIAVNWTAYNEEPYIESAVSVKAVGDHLGRFILNITKGGKRGLLSNVHLIGYSLGAHVAGFAGQLVKNETRIKVGRITGLDAAFPVFDFPARLSSDLKLSGGQAGFVDAIHTCGGVLGTPYLYGAVDFYINGGGPVQPGCLSVNPVETFTCSHGYSVEVFTKSVGKEKTYAVSCVNQTLFKDGGCDNNKRTIVGEDVPHNASGPYYT